MLDSFKFKIHPFFTTYCYYCTGKHILTCYKERNKNCNA